MSLALLCECIKPNNSTTLDRQISNQNRGGGDLGDLNCYCGLCGMFLCHMYCLLLFCPCIDLTLTTEKLMTLFAPLDPGKVDKLGGEDYLGLPQSEIDRLQKNYQSPTQRKEAYLDLYIHQHPCPTWGQVALVLHIINLPLEADLVENTYVKGTQDTQYIRKLCMLLSLKL